MESSQRGSVHEYDSSTGIGSIATTSGDLLSFQCTQLLDGSREVESGASVCFDRLPGGPGVWEAGNITTVAS